MMEHRQIKWTANELEVINKYLNAVHNSIHREMRRCEKGSPALEHYGHVWRAVFEEQGVIRHMMFKRQENE